MSAQVLIGYTNIDANVLQEGHMGVLSLLLAHGADPTHQDHHGRDPYRVALRNNNAAVAGKDENFHLCRWRL